MAAAVHLRTCPLCEAMCGLEVHVVDDTVTKVVPRQADVWSKGYICPKGTALGALHHDPDRLRAPMVRTGSDWREVSWQEAFDTCARLLHPVIAAHGLDAVSAYIGNPTAHNFSLSRYIGVLIGMSGIPRIYSAGTVDQWPKNVACALMYGGMWTIPVPDLPRTDHIVILGANPQASQGSLLACPDVLGELAAVRRRGGTVVVVDPRRTGTADVADEWVPIVPGTDAALLMALVSTLFAEGLVRTGAVALTGVAEVAALAASWTPERVPAERIRRMARELAGTPRAVLYGRIGTCNQEFGTLASWLVDVVNILTGHFDVEGGLMFPRPVAPGVTTLDVPGQTYGEIAGRWHSRVRGLPEVLGQVPLSCLGEEMDTPGPGQIRALITVAGNPAVSAPGAARIRAALPGLDAMISIDNWLNETTRHAHVILPGLSALEMPHFDDLIWGFAVRSGGKWSPPVFPPAPGRPAEWEILTRLAGIIAGQPAAEVDVAALDDLFFSYLVGANGLDQATVAPQYTTGGPERMLDLQIRSGPFGDRYGERDGLRLADFQAAGDGIDLGPMVPRLAEVLRTPDATVHLSPPYITADLPRLAARLDRPSDGLVLVSRRHQRSNNSWMHNVAALVRGTNRCTLLVHPTDAQRFGLLDGEPAEVSSTAGRIEVPVEVSDEMRPGVVSLPHGWGHDDDATRLGVARTVPGANSNLLAPPDLLDVPSGNAVVNGFGVTVAPVRAAVGAGAAVRP